MSADPTRPQVSVIVPCRNEARYIEAFLASLIAQQEPAGGFEVIIADGMSNDGTRALIEKTARQHPNFRIIDNPAKFVSTGLNQAIRSARGEIIVRMDVHTEYAPDYIRQCVNLLEKTGAGNVGGPARTRSDGYLQGAICLAYHSPFSSGGASFHNPDYEGRVDTVTYGCWRKQTLEEVGLFDEELVRNQDDELNLRLNRKGYAVWQSPQIKSWYHPRASLGALFRQYSQYGYWKVRVIQKHRIPASIRHLIPGAFVASLIGLALLSPFLPAARWLLLAELALYTSANFLATLLTCLRSKSARYLPVLPLIFAVYHFSYGYGFLRGLIDFVLLRKGGSRNFTRLSRAEGAASNA